MQDRTTRLARMRRRGTEAWYLAIAKVLGSRRALAEIWALVAVALIVTCGFGWKIAAWAVPPALVLIGVLMSTQQHDARRMDRRLRDELAVADRGEAHASPTDRSAS